MIPRIDVDLNPQLPTDATFWTPKREDLSEEGFGYFRDTWLIRGVGVRIARALMKVEAGLASLAGELARSPEEFDELARALESGDIEAVPEGLSQDRTLARIAPHIGGGDESPPLEGLELGVAGLVYALASVGCWPAASCRGHPGSRAWSDCPVVLLAAKELRAKALAPCVASAGCGFGIDAARPDLLAVQAPSIEETIVLAQVIMDKRKAFSERRSESKRLTPPTSQLSLLTTSTSITRTSREHRFPW